MNVFDMGWLFIPIIMVVLGGTGTILGPWLGALIVYAITWYGGKYFPGWHPVILGVLMILVMLFLPSGIMGSRRECQPPVLQKRLTRPIERGSRGHSAADRRRTFAVW